MAKYIYESIDKYGKVIKGTVEADDLYTFKNYLNANNLYLIKYKEKKGIPLYKKGSIKSKDLIVITKEFSAMLNAGISLMRCLEIMHTQATNKKFKDMYLKIYTQVQKGVELSEAMASVDGAFSEFMINMIRTGETSGTLALTMERLSTFYEKEVRINRKVLSAMMYPIVLTLVTFLIVIIIFGFVMPSFAPMFEQMESLPLGTAILLNISEFFVDSWYFLIIALIGIFALILSIVNIPLVRKTYDQLKLELPVVGVLIKKILAARFCYTMSSMLNSGLNIILALEVSTKVLDNLYLVDKIDDSIDEIKKGIPLSEALNNLGVFPPMMISMINIGEESGDTEAMMDVTSSYYEGEADTAIQSMISLLEPIMIIILGVIVTFVIIAVMLPLYDMYQTM